LTIRRFFLWSPANAYVAVLALNCSQMLYDPLSASKIDFLRPSGGTIKTQTSPETAFGAACAAFVLYSFSRRALGACCSAFFSGFSDFSGVSDFSGLAVFASTGWTTSTLRWLAVPIWNLLPDRSCDSNSIVLVKSALFYSFAHFSSWFFRTRAKNLILSFASRF
jgi:hypothetical protein